MVEIYGVDVFDQDELLSRLPNLAADTPDECRQIFHTSQKALANFLAIHDPFEIVAKSTSQALAHQLSKRKHLEAGNVKEAIDQSLIEGSDVEILQAFALMQTGDRKIAPASPKHLERFYSNLRRLALAFTRMQPVRYPDDPERERVIRKARLYTVYRRNIFTRDDCETVVRAILRRVDEAAIQQYGYAFSDMFTALIAVSNEIEDRNSEFWSHARAVLQAKTEQDIIPHIEFYCEISPSAKRAWALGRRRCNTLDLLQWAAFQLSELCNSWICTLDKQSLKERYGEKALLFFERLSIRPGELASSNPEHFFLNNPIWRRPFVNLSDDELFLALPNLFYGFPFQIFEQFIMGKPQIEEAYSKARASFLEEMIEIHISTGMPSARTYRKVMWQDETTNRTYENDVVSIIGNTIFLFEAKSGRLDDVARRGGELSLLQNFRKLFVEPGEQATRLENYINAKGKDARLWLKDTGETVDLNLDKPKVVHKFSICIEHFASLTSAKYNLKILGAVTDENAWSPVLSLGELMLVWRHLDTEVSLFHYLTRRATLEDLIDFEGDEQDILSMYLINGLCIDPDKVKGRKVQFLEIDSVTREEKTPRTNRTEFEIYGIPLSRYWKALLKEVYEHTALRHRFDIIQVVLNQDPHSLAGIEQIVRKWKNGLGGTKGRDVLYSRFKIGKRIFVLACYLSRHAMTTEEWIERSRTIARDGASSMFEASDCVVIGRAKKSREWTYDGISFHRLGREMPRREM